MPKATVRAKARTLPEKTKRRAVKKKAQRSAVARTVDDSPVARLSFVRTYTRIPRGKFRGRCFWNVESSGDGIADDVRGTNAALEYLAYEASPLSGGILQLIVADMPQTLGAGEISFLSTVAKAAVAGVNGGFDLRLRTRAELEQKISEAVCAMSAMPKVAA